MKEENKYYTPEINEFYIGFEYEFKGSIKWHKYIYTQKDFEIENLKEELASNNIRIKYLDKEDIESFGWNLNQGTGFFYFKGNIKTKLYFDDKCKINNENSIGITICMNDSILFNGWLYNKSELMRLLKQLGIQ